MSRTLGARLSTLAEPEVVTDLLQIAKVVIAGTTAWWLSMYILDSQLPFLALWTALLTVHATVHRSLSRGMQATIASTVGVLLSFMVGAWLGVSVWTFALALLVGLLGARITWIRDEGVTIATTAIFVLGGGFDGQQPLLLDRIIEVALGVIVGVVVNLAVMPPLRHRQASRYVDSINRRMGVSTTGGKTHAGPDRPTTPSLPPIGDTRKVTRAPWVRWGGIAGARCLHGRPV